MYLCPMGTNRGCGCRGKLRPYGQKRSLTLGTCYASGGQPADNVLARYQQRGTWDKAVPTGSALVARRAPANGTARRGDHKVPDRGPRTERRGAR